MKGFAMNVTLFDRLVMKSPGWSIRLLIWLRGCFSPPSLLFDSDFIAASKWAEEYAPTGQAEVYKLVSAFAERQYNLALASSDGLDKKADELLRYMAAITGALTAAASAKLIKFEHPAIVVFGAILVTWAIVLAFRSRAPTSMRTPMRPADLLKVADLESQPTASQLEGVLAASYHVAIERMQTLTTWKSALLNQSSLAFLAGCLLFLLAAIVPI